MAHFCRKQHPGMGQRRSQFDALLRICDILVRIRIRSRILGSVVRTFDSRIRMRIRKAQKNTDPDADVEWGPGSLVHLNHSSKIKSPKEVINQTLNSRNQGFSYYFCLAMEGSGAGSIPIWVPDPGGPRYTDPDADPDPQHWFEVRQSMDLQKFFLPFKKDFQGRSPPKT